MVKMIFKINLFSEYKMEREVVGMNRQVGINRQTGKVENKLNGISDIKRVCE